MLCAFGKIEPGETGCRLLLNRICFRQRFNTVLSWERRRLAGQSVVENRYSPARRQRSQATRKNFGLSCSTMDDELDVFGKVSGHFSHDVASEKLDH